MPSEQAHQAAPAAGLCVSLSVVRSFECCELDLSCSHSPSGSCTRASLHAVARSSL